jgi:hypothetical protein
VAFSVNFRLLFWKTLKKDEVIPIYGLADKSIMNINSRVVLLLENERVKKKHQWRLEVCFEKVFKNVGCAVGNQNCSSGFDIWHQRCWPVPLRRSPADGVVPVSRRNSCSVEKGT